MNLQESIRRILREESDKVMNMQSKILSQFRKQDQMERNEYSKFVQSEFGGDYERGAKEYAKIKNRNSDDIFGDKKRIREFILINFDFNTFSSKDWENYWLLSQHSDNHPEFQKKALNIIKQNLGEDNEYYEYLHDRISCRESGTQIYGTQNICKKSKMNLQESIRRILKEDAEIKSNYQKVIDNFKKILPERYAEKIDEIFMYIKDFIDKEGFQIKVLNNCQVIFKGIRTKNFIVICSPESYTSLAELVYIIFHEIRHEIQMGKLGQINPLSGDLENFDELYKMYWEMEMDAHEYAIEWVDKIGDIINLPKEYYKLSPMVTKYPTMSHMVRDQIVSINEMIKELKRKGYDYNDISDLPFVKKHLDKLEDLF